MPLSAVAARKANLATKQKLETSNGVGNSNANTTKELPPPASPSLIEQPNVASTSRGESMTPKKRKSRAETTPQKSQTKKQKKLVNADIGRTRYFEAQQPIKGFDDDDALDVDVSNLPEGRSLPYSPSQPIPIHEISEDDGLTSRFVTEDPRPSRPYSPSQPIIDSSDEEDGENILKRSAQLSSEPYSDFQNTSTDELSFETFVPQLDLNVFCLTQEELKDLRFLGDDDSQTAHLFLIPSRQSFTFVGTARFTLLHGSINVLGTTLRPSRLSHRVFSPRSNPLTVIKALDPPMSIASDGHEEKISFPQRLRAMLQSSSDSVVVIQPLHTGVERLGKVCPIFERAFDSGQDHLQEDTDKKINIRGFHILNKNMKSKYHIQPFYISESWKTALDDVVPPLQAETDKALDPTKALIAMIKGPKKCGKSTFARTLLNCLTTRYRRVAFLECDIGQSEFTPGGMVSLHIISSPVFGPPFTHPTIPYRAHYVGNTTPRSTPAHYLASIEALIQTYRMDVQYTYRETSASEQYDIDNSDTRLDGFIPLVVNTQGWIKGLGGDLLRKIEDIIEPTNIFDLEVQSAPQRQQSLSGARLHQVEPILLKPLTTLYAPADYRTLSILSYFHAVFHPRGGEAVAWSVDLPLCAKPPWEVDCKEAIDSIILTGAGYEDVIPTELHHAINCGVVGLVCDEDSMTNFPIDDSQNDLRIWPYTQGGSVPSPATSQCIGLALIRGVDVKSGSLHIITPVPPSLLQKCRILVKGELEIPVWSMIDFREGRDEGIAGVKWDKVPYLQMGATAIGGARRRVRKNLMRRGQL